MDPLFWSIREGESDPGRPDQQHLQRARLAQLAGEDRQCDHGRTLEPLGWPLEVSLQGGGL